jgi:hypothetical protein
VDFTPAAANFSPEGVAIDSAGNVWITNYGAKTVTVMNNDGTLLGNFGVGRQSEAIAPQATRSYAAKWSRSYRTEACATRLTVHRGDLEAQALGLYAEISAYLAAPVDAIYHCGARVNFAAPYSDLNRPTLPGRAADLTKSREGFRECWEYCSSR